jgi:NAD(P)-dependent dehydrogenase (short-subunit alcohol dehydrogenase family)
MYERSISVPFNRSSPLLCRSVNLIMDFCKRSVPFHPSQDIPPLDGKVILVTGGNVGLGKQCILEYARHNPAEIWLAARNLDKAKVAVEEINAQLSTPTPIKLLELDLASLESVRKAAAKFASESTRLDILMLNAGIMAAPPGLTVDGYELQFGTNYLGHALFAKLLLPTMRETASKPEADVRILMITSHGHTYAPKEGVLFDTLRTDGDSLGPYGRYGQSKLAMYVVSLCGLLVRRLLTCISTL